MDPEPTENQNDIPNNVNYARLIEDENEFVYIRESNSAPLDSPPIQKSNMQCCQLIVWKSQNFSVYQNLREIKVAETKSQNQPS